MPTAATSAATNRQELYVEPEPTITPLLVGVAVAAFLFSLGGVAFWLVGRGDGDSLATSAAIVSGPSTTARLDSDDFGPAPIDIATLPPKQSELDSLVESEPNSRAETTDSHGSTTTEPTTTPPPTDPPVTVTEPFPLVNLVGQTQPQAESQLAAAGLGFEISSRPSLAPAAQVLSTTPGEGSNVESGATIAIVVSSGPPCVLPELVGLTVATMSDALSAAGCPAAKQSMVVSDLRANTVVSANLVETTVGVDVVAQVSQADGLTIGSPSCEVPAVAGRTVAAARVAVKAAGCTGRITVAPSDSPGSALVLSVQPSAGALIGAESTITLTADNGDVLPPTTTTTRPTASSTATSTTPSTATSTTITSTTSTTATSTTSPTTTNPTTTNLTTTNLTTTSLFTTSLTATTSASTTATPTTASSAATSIVDHGDT